jgi:hypothetical protein
LSRAGPQTVLTVVRSGWLTLGLKLINNMLSRREDADSCAKYAATASIMLSRTYFKIQTT